MIGGFPGMCSEAPVAVIMSKYSTFHQAASMTRPLYLSTVSILAALAACALLFSVSGCGGYDSDASRSASASTATRETALTGEKDAQVIFKAKGGDQALQVEIADSESERSRGLMERTSLDENSGMIFVWSEPTQGGFWMKNTLIPLSIAFISADGRILDIQDMEPETLDPHVPAQPYMYAVEVNQGYFQRHGIATGDKVELTGI